LKYVVLKDGRVVECGVSTSAPIGHIPVSDEEYSLISVEPYAYRFDSEFIYDPPPSPYHAWVGGEWVTDESILLAYKNSVWEKIKAERERRKFGGVRIVVSGQPYWIHSDEGSRLQHLGLAIAAVAHFMNIAPFPTETPWKTMENNPDGSIKVLPLTPQIALQIFNADAAADIQNFAVGRAHYDALMQSEDPINYDYSGNWLPVFGE
jgi:hypothetical protein